MLSVKILIPRCALARGCASRRAEMARFAAPAIFMLRARGFRVCDAQALAHMEAEQLENQAFVPFCKNWGKKGVFALVPVGFGRNLLNQTQFRRSTIWPLLCSRLDHHVHSHCVPTALNVHELSM